MANRTITDDQIADLLRFLGSKLKASADLIQATGFLATLPLNNSQQDHKKKEEVTPTPSASDKKQGHKK